MKLALKPRESVFQDILNRHVAVLRQAAIAMHETLTVFDRLGERLALIDKLEQEGDDLALEMVEALTKAFITPLDREDLHELSNAVESVLGYIQATSNKLAMYHVGAPSPPAALQAEVLVRMADLLVDAFSHLNRLSDMPPLWDKVKDLEREGDQLCAAAIADLFDGSRAVIDVLKWKEIHEDLEEAIDRAEDVYDVLETIMVKNG